MGGAVGGDGFDGETVGSVDTDKGLEHGYQSVHDNGSNCKWLTFFINGGSLKRQVGSPVTKAGGWRLLRR